MKWSLPSGGSFFRFEDAIKKCHPDEPQPIETIPL